MKKNTFLFLFLIALNIVNAQKSAPVMGDAATLIDLLKKDYSTVNPDTKLEEIKTDREKVIAIFKSYIQDKEKETIVVTKNEKEKLIEKGDKRKNKNGEKKDYFNQLKAYNTLSKVSINLSKEYKVSDVKESIDTIETDLNDAKNEYYTEKYELDSIVLIKLDTIYKDNPYLTEVINLFKAKYRNLNTNQIDYLAQYNHQSSVQKSLPFIGGDLAFETIIDGLSRFLAKRIKEELTLHAIDKIKKYLEDPKPENYSQELAVILPKTTNYLKRFDANQLLNFTNELKQLIEQDMNAILDNAKGLREVPKIQTYIANNPDLEFAFDGLEIIPQLSKIKNPVDYFELLENSEALSNWRNDTAKKEKYNIAQSLRLASMLAYSLTVVDNGEQKFASIDFISNYGNETNFYFLYFGFLHQQNLKYFDIKFIKDTPVNLTIKTIMDSLSVPNVKDSTKDFNFIKDNLIKVVQYSEKIHSTAQSIKKKNKNNEEIKYEEIHDFINQIIGFTQGIVATADLLIENKYNVVALPTSTLSYSFKEKLTPYFSIANTANDLVLDLHEKKYSNAIIKAIEIPLWLKSTNQDDKINLYRAKTIIENHSDMLLLSRAFNPDINAAEIKELSTSLKILSLKLEGNSELSFVHKELDILSKKESVKEYKTHLELLRATIKKHQKELLKHFDIDTEEIKKTVLAYLEKKNQPQTVQNYFSTQLDAYTVAVFNHTILHDKKGEEGSMAFEKELGEMFLAFAPDYIANNDVLKDTQALKIIHFLNDISLSSTPEDVEKAIDAFALPVGSSSLKERAKSYYAINAFPGITGGFEFSDNQDRATNIGFTAPIGIYIQPWGSGKKGSSFGFFLPIIDIAAPVRLRLDDNSDTETLPDFNFNDIFSPGFYAVYGFRNSPFTINLGGQYGPKLRDIADGNNELTSVDSYRINLGLTIDIPLVTLSGKYKN